MQISFGFRYGGKTVKNLHILFSYKQLFADSSRNRIQKRLPILGVHCRSCATVAFIHFESYLQISSCFFLCCHNLFVFNERYKGRSASNGIQCGFRTKNGKFGNVVLSLFPCFPNIPFYVCILPSSESKNKLPLLRTKTGTV